MSPQARRPHSLNGPLTDVRRVTSLSGRDPTKPQEQGNTKKKRRSLMDMEAVAVPVPFEIPEPEPDPDPEHELRPSSPEDRSYGDPVKIAKFFPELALSR